jgi:hypothetical protein
MSEGFGPRFFCLPAMSVLIKQTKTSALSRGVSLSKSVNND